MSRYKSLMDDLAKEGKLRSLETVVTPEVINRMNIEMEKVRKDFRRKDAESKQAAGTVILNA